VRHVRVTLRARRRREIVQENPPKGQGKKAVIDPADPPPRLTDPIDRAWLADWLAV
jgi:hypothetical protein